MKGSASPRMALFSLLSLLRSLFNGWSARFLKGGKLPLLDSCLLAGKFTQVEDSRSAHLADLVQFDAVDEGGLEREDPFDPDSARHLADSESLGLGSGAFELQDYASEFLESIFVAFLDPVVDRDGVARLEFRERSNFLVSESLLSNIHQIHFNTIFSATLRTSDNDP